MKTRFCPSPTGMIHLGNARTALFNGLFAEGHPGQFLLRIEDTDRTRSDEKYTQALQQDLQWLGLQWDEGPGHDLGNGPYWQSERQKFYDEFYQKLLASDDAYPCFCTEQELKIAKRVQIASGRPPRYRGTCRAIDKHLAKERMAANEPHTLRFKVPNDDVVEFDDLVKGHQRFATNDLGDFIIRRTDGTPPFMYCNAVDDAMMGVTHVLRGEDHLTNTPRQILILLALKLPVPTYGHISLIVGPDGAPLSKRHGSRSIAELRAAGYLSLGVINYLARLGHYYTSDELLSAQQLAEQFSLKSLGSAPARFDQKQLDYWQHQAVLHAKPEALWDWMGEAVHALVPEQQRSAFIQLVQPNIVFAQDALEWAQILFTSELEFNGEATDILNNAVSGYFPLLLKQLDTHGVDYQQWTQALKTELGVKGKALFMPLRVALTGKQHGPELAPLVALLDPEVIKQRFSHF